MRSATIAAATALAIIAALLAATTAAAANRTWHGCSKTATKAAAETAGLAARMDADERLRMVFGDEPPSTVLVTITASLCADFDGDGDVDRLAMYGCCTVSSPAPFAILRNDGGSYAIAYSRLHDAVFSIRGEARELVERDPKYARDDANCCPSQIRVRRISWTGTRFRSREYVRRA